MQKNITVFVYGSLKKGFGNHRCLRGAEYVGTAKANGRFKMVSLGGFPGVIEDHTYEQREIDGELYRVDTDGLGALDCLEGHPEFYERKKKNIAGSRAWIYFLDKSYAAHEEVESGCWT